MPGREGQEAVGTALEALPFAEVARRSRVPILLTDPTRPDNPIVFVNDAFLRLSGYGAEEVIGRNCRLLQGPDTDPQTVAELRQAIRERREANIVVLNYRRDGTSFWNELFITPLAAEGGEATHFLGMQYDVTARITAERSVHATRDALQARLREREVLLREIHHRVRNNIQAISAMLEAEAVLSGPAARASLTAASRRVLTLAVAHRCLERSPDLSHITLTDALAELLSDLGPPGSTGSYQAGDLSCEMETAVPVMLVVSELLASAGHGGAPLTLTLTRAGSEAPLLLEIGGGTPVEEVGASRALLTALCAQVGAVLSFGDPARVEFPPSMFV